MKPALAAILARLPGEDEDVEAAEAEVTGILDAFTTRFP